jgi:hypothetical protein
MIAVFKTDTNELELFNDLTAAAQFAGVSPNTIRHHLNPGTNRAILRHCIVFKNVMLTKSKRGRRTF